MIFSKYISCLVETYLLESKDDPVVKYIIGKFDALGSVAHAFSSLKSGYLLDHVKYDFERHSKLETDAHVDALDILFPTDVIIDITEQLKERLNHGKMNVKDLTATDKFNIKNLKTYKTKDRVIDRKDVVAHSTPYAIQESGRIRSIYYDQTNNEFYRITTTPVNKPNAIISAFKMTRKQVRDILDGLSADEDYIVDYNRYIVYYRPLHNKPYELRKIVDPFAKV